jgi:Mg-chelatase subunit ChlD
MPMTDQNKAKAKHNIDSMNPIDQTNLWSGLNEGIKLFGEDTDTGRAPAIMLLTDGCPNHMEPAQGYVPKLRNKKKMPATIHTFGFGYQLRSGLLKSLAEFGSGNYSFIPDAGMIVSFFVGRLGSDMMEN